MPHVLEPAGDAALAAAMAQKPLLGFDFDGTLAPIVPRPEDARISKAVSEKLERLARCAPVAIVTGRTAADVRSRLDFEPFCVIGNHGADIRGDVEAQRTVQSLDRIRSLLDARSNELRRAGVVTEDKGLSIALHYRLSRSPAQARELLRGLLQGVEPQFRTFSGKMVENIVPVGLPDKGAAMRHLAQQCGATCAIFVGDDINDEPVFATAPASWLGVRVGRDDPRSQADYFLDSPSEIGMLLDRLLTHVLHGP